MSAIISMLGCEKEIPKVKYLNKRYTALTPLGQSKKYVLKMIASDADFNYKRISKLDDLLTNLDSSDHVISFFEPVTGSYKFYQFIATYKGEAYSRGDRSEVKEFHDLLILKTDAEDAICDAYQYTIEWAEMPHQSDLLKAQSKQVRLKENLSIEHLQLKRTYKPFDYPSETGRLSLLNHDL
ncbi:hypothetical protein ACAW74_24385 [Fibrella sp. WM1]|uniref:hypothetical protein n=1 Tax=Fibrella musci TaxID=3242485 RepID=UPI0035228FAF